jgi:hypothetical protein
MVQKQYNHTEHKILTPFAGGPCMHRYEAVLSLQPIGCMTGPRKFGDPSTGKEHDAIKVDGMLSLGMRVKGILKN